MALMPTRSNTMPLPAGHAPACDLPPPSERAQDFSGSIKVSQKPPTHKDLERVANLPVLDANGSSHTFSSIYQTPSHDRVLLLFVRHFFCGNCQEYLRSLLPLLPPTSLPPRTTVLIIGHGQPDLIAFYASAVSSPYPIYADPSKRLYAELGMARTLSLGPEKPVYMQRSMLGVMWSSMVQNILQGRKAFHGGDYWQVGGEMVLVRGKGGRMGRRTSRDLEEEGSDRPWGCEWIHRMENTRDHAEVGRVVEMVGMVEVVGGKGGKAEEEEKGNRSSSEDETVKAKLAARPSVRKRWTLGAGGVRRSLSLRREGWSRSRSRGVETRVAVA